MFSPYWYLVVLLIANLAFANSNKIETMSSEKLSFFELKSSQEEEEIGKLLVELSNSLNKNLINLRIVKGIEKHKLLDQFFSLGPEVQLIKKLGDKNKKAEEVKQLCVEYENQYKVQSSYLYDRINNICRKLFFEKIVNQDITILLKQENLDYIRDNLDYLFSSEKKAEAKTFFNKLQKNEIAFKIIANLIVRESIGSKRSIPDLVLDHPLFIQNVNMDQNINSEQTSVIVNYFDREVQNRFRDIRDNLKTNKVELVCRQIEDLFEYFGYYSRSITNEKFWINTIELGKELLFVYGLTESAMELIKFSNEIASPENKDMSLFLLLWANVYAKRYKDNLKLIQEKNILARWDSYDPRLKFWIAYSYEKNNMLKEADQYYFKIVESSFFSYYSVLSLKRLNIRNVLSEKKFQMQNFLKPVADTTLDVQKCEVKTTNFFRRINLWSKLSYGIFIHKEIEWMLRTVDKKIMEDKKISSEAEYKGLIITNIISVLSRNSQHLAMFKLFEQSLAQNTGEYGLEVLQKLFPTMYWGKIEEYKTGLDPALILSLIRQESAFNTHARSPAGARGLMQLMPATAKMIRRNVRTEKLHVPDINLELGIKYFNELVKKFDGNLIHVLSAYNAGENATKRWKEKYLNSDDPIVDVESIPYKETRAYVKLIYRNVFFYNLLKQDQDITKAIPSGFFVEYKIPERSTH